MKVPNIFLLIMMSLSVACTSSTLSEIASHETSPSPSPAAQSTPTLSAMASSPALTSPIETPALSQNSPIATASPEATHVDGQAEERQAVFPNTIIVYQEVEGDRQQQWTVYHTGRILAGDGTEWQTESRQIRPLFDLVESPNFWELERDYGLVGECVDCLKQIVTIYYEGEVTEITVTDGTVDLPQSLRKVLDLLVRLSVERD